MTAGAATPLLAAARDPDRAARAPGLGPILSLAVVLSACSLVYELLAAHTLAQLAYNAVVWYSLALGGYLAAMGAGAWWSGRVRDERCWPVLFRVELLLTVVGAVMVPLIHLGHALHAWLVVNDAEGAGTAVFLLTGGALVLAVGFLTGIELPVLMRLGQARRGGAPSAASAVLGFDYIGALVGGVAFPLLLLPTLGPLSLGLLVALVNLAVALWVLAVPLHGRPRAWRGWLAAAGLALALLTGLATAPTAHAWLLKAYYYYLDAPVGFPEHFQLADFQEVQTHRSPYQRIDIVHDPNPGWSAALMTLYSGKLAQDPQFPADWILCLDGAFQTNTRYEEVYHEWFAHVPIVTWGVPERVLVLGGGDGFLLRELVKYDGIASIVHVDIDEVLVQLARNHPVLRHVNEDSLRDPRVETRLMDGFRWIAETDETFDAIFIDFPVAADFDLARLYSREFFERVRQRLAPGGYAVFDATGTSYLTPPAEDGRRFLDPRNDWPIYRETVRAAGFGTARPFLTTLDPRPPGALELARRSVAASAARALQAAGAEGAVSPEQLEGGFSEDALNKLLDFHVVALEQGFVLLAPDERPVDVAWADPGVPRHVLDQRHYELAFAVEFPWPDEPDPSKVNSIVRPTLPTLPWFEPRLPY